MKGMTLWKCIEEDCEDTTIYRYKGLCRGCTTYELGEPKKAVSRVKVTEAGTPIESLEKLPFRPVTSQDYKNLRRSQKRLTNKQHQALTQAHQHTHNEHDGRHAHSCGNEQCEDVNCDSEVMDIGEAVEEE